MKILLTGANGFIGRNIYEILSSRHDITTLSHKEINLTDYNAVKEFISGGKFDAVIHSASKPTHRAAENTSDAPLTNLVVYAVLAKAAASSGVKKFLTYGSGSEYNMYNNLYDVKEEQLGCSVPTDNTGFPKYLMNFIRETGMKMHNLRCFGVFGRYEDYSIRFISNAICRALYDYSITLKQDRLFSYLYIDDLVEITDCFLKYDFKYYDYNITPYEKWSLLNIARLVRKVTLKDVPINVALDGFGLQYTGSNSRLHKELNFTYTTMIDAVRMLVDWYILNFDKIDKEKILYAK